MRSLEARLLVMVCGLLFSGLVSAQKTSETSVPPTADAKVCVSAADMTEFAGNFKQFANLSGKEYCLDGSQTSGLIESLVFMKRTVFEQPTTKSPDELFSGKFSKDWYGYFTGRIDEMDVQPSCEKGVGAYVYMFGNTMYVCPMMLTANFTALDRASVFMHEARHIDGFPHVTCNRGPRMGMQGACDKAIADGGSYAVSVETYAQIGKYATGLHPALRAYAKASAVTYADEAFNSEVKIDREPKFNLLTTNRDFYQMDPNATANLQSLGQAPELGRIVLRAQFMILFPENKASRARYMFAKNEGEISQQAGDLATEYNDPNSRLKDSFVDAHIGTQWVTTVTTDKVRMACDPRSPNTKEISFVGGERAKSLLYPQGYDRAAKVLQLQMESGKVFDLSCGPGGAPSMKMSGQQFDRVFKKMYRLGALTLGLDDKGGLFRIQGNVSTALPTSVDGQIYEMAPAQTQDFFEDSLISSASLTGY